ncbi:extracellular solute-binding protein [Salinibacterium sp. SYSU T00001]|uniref:extracellular solute-binding protein n=1 Tax=Homoserinimonas sedimenticola TaxID=2986805 RepID=UPI002235B775|nr:extracellular solute-binding protein [Salinibacterium sedimenticola]MCW4385085.1 extracellular solute-binding protein [Salinibacterium sedimenticola]
MHRTAAPGRNRNRSLLGLAGAAALAIAMAGCSTPAAEGETSGGEVVFADYGGPTNESRQIAYFDSFQDETGTRVVSASLQDAIMYSMLEGEEGDYDLIQVSSDSLIKYKENLAVLPDGVPRADTFPEEIQDYAVGGFLIGITQGWLTDTFPDGGPQDWADFFDTEKYPGKRAWPGAPGSYDASFELALLADGVAPEDLYPLDLDRAVAKLDSIRDDLVFYESYPEVQTLLSTGSASIAVSVTGQFTALMNQGLDVTVQWNEAFLSPNFFVIPESAENKEAAYELATWLADGERQAVFTERTFYGPANEATFDYLPEDVASKLPGGPGNDGSLYFDEQYRADYLEELTSSYTEWLAG